MIQKAGGEETGSARRVEVEKGMITIEVRAERKTGIEGEGEMSFDDRKKVVSVNHREMETGLAI